MVITKGAGTVIIREGLKEQKLHENKTFSSNLKKKE